MIGFADAGVNADNTHPHGSGVDGFALRIL